MRLWYVNKGRKGDHDLTANNGGRPGEPRRRRRRRRRRPGGLCLPLPFNRRRIRTIGGILLCLLLLLLWSCYHYQNYLFGQGPTIQGGMLGRKLDNTIKTLLFVWRNRRYHREIREMLGNDLAAQVVKIEEKDNIQQTGVPVLLYTYIRETMVRAQQRQRLHQQLLSTTTTSICPECLIVPLVGRWYRHSLTTTALSLLSQQLEQTIQSLFVTTNNGKVTVVPFQESEMEEWMFRQLVVLPSSASVFESRNDEETSGNDNSDSTTNVRMDLWERYQSFHSQSIKIQFAALFMILAHGGVFVGDPDYIFDDQYLAQHYENSRNDKDNNDPAVLEVVVNQETRDLLYMRAQRPVLWQCKIGEFAAAVVKDGLDWSALVSALTNVCPKDKMNSSLIRLRQERIELQGGKQQQPGPRTIMSIVPASAKEETAMKLVAKQPIEHELVLHKCRAGWLCHRCLRLPWRGSLQACQFFCDPCYVKIVSGHNTESPIIEREVIYNVVAQLPKERDSEVASATTSTTTHQERIPRIIHQTWFEDITTARYPHFARLQNSWKAMVGWEYRFYTDETARVYVTTHYPTRFVQAYDALIPGAFKADLFRLLVLLREGGVYADIDVQLDIDLDTFLGEAEISFFVPRDCPIDRWPNSNYCLWNGFMGSTPGHPILLQAVEDVMNHVLNRQDYYDLEGALIQSNPATEIWKLRSIPILLLTGPCALGMSLNKAAAEAMAKDDATTVDAASNISQRPNTIDPLRGFPVGWLPEMKGVLLLHTDRYDLDELRFTDLDRNLLIASTNANAVSRQPIIPQQQQEQQSEAKASVKTEAVHYSKSESEIVGAHGIYNDNLVANERILLRYAPQIN